MFNTHVVIRALEFVTLRGESSLVMRNNNVVSGADVIPTVYADVVVWVSFHSIVACLFERQRVCLSKGGKRAEFEGTSVLH